MNCVEVQDLLWESDASPELLQHVRGCPTCAPVPSEIARLRASLALEAPPGFRLAAGVMARMAVRRRPWGAVARYAAGILIGVLGVLAAGPQPAPAPAAATRVPDPPSALHRLVGGLDADPAFEETFIHVLNETLRRRSEMAHAPRHMEDQP